MTNAPDDVRLITNVSVTVDHNGRLTPDSLLTVEDQHGNTIAEARVPGSTGPDSAAFWHNVNVKLFAVGWSIGTPEDYAARMANPPAPVNGVIRFEARPVR